MRAIAIALRTAALACAFTGLTGCAFGNKITYSSAKPDIAAKGDKSVAVTVHDQRPYVLAKDKGPQFVGVMRSMYGIPYNINTPKDVPLADEMSQTLVSALNDRGFKATEVRASFDASRRIAQEALQKSGAERLVMVALNEWKTDTYFGTSLEYDVKVTVSDKDGAELASEIFRGDDDIGKMAPPVAFQRKAEDWFSRPSIVAALK